MSENKITQEEMIGWFGSEMPMEAVNLVWNAPPEKTIGEIRAELRAMGEAWKAKRSESIVERVAIAIWCDRFSELDWDESEKRDYVGHARAAIEAMRELPGDPGPRYSAGEYSRRTQEAMVDDALGT